MTEDLSEGIHRDGFVSFCGRFTVDGIECVEGSRLRNMFLPKRSPEGLQAIESHPRFVHSQLKHYGVHFVENEIYGNGTVFIKSTLQAGMCFQVPRHIAEMEKQMREEWLKKLSLVNLLDRPDSFMQIFFLSDEQSDSAKRTSAVAIPLDRVDENSSRSMIEAAKRISQLHHVEAVISKIPFFIMGWNEAVLEEVAT